MSIQIPYVESGYAGKNQSEALNKDKIKPILNLSARKAKLP
jgi:hypothetical protein